MSATEQDFAKRLDSCESLLKAEREAIEKADAESIENILSLKDDAFDKLRSAGEKLTFPPTENPSFATRLESIFAAQQTNLELMQKTLSTHRKKVEEVQQGQARLLKVKGAYLPSFSRVNRTRN
tara:strand:+ start:10196 stop:10567 length:372 start_codon:yes stop_codon:yes gene_type:complete